jgi:peptide/nickel transport system substrate-binding protein
VTLNTAPFAAGAVEAAQVFAQQAKGAGVKVTVNSLDSGTFYGPNYLKWSFAQDFWNTRNYLAQVAAGMLPTSPYNEPHWNNRRYVALHAEAMRTLKKKKRYELIHEMQMLEWNQGGLMVWAFNNFLDAYSNKVSGLHPARSQLRLDRYGFSGVSFV